MSVSCLIATTQTWPSTASLPALMRAAGASVSAFSPGTLALSSHVTHHVAGSREPGLAALQLRALLARRHFDSVIVADELLLRALIDSGDRESMRDWFPVDPRDDAALDLLLSKHAFATRAGAAGIPVPQSALATTAAEAAAHARRFGYPVVVKGDAGYAGLEVDIVADERALLERASAVIARYGHALIQRRIVGTSASACVLYQHGRVHGYKAYRTECPYPTPMSASTVHEYFAHPALTPIVEAVGSATSFHGMLGIDFMIDGVTGALYAIEINPRPTSGFSGSRENRRFFAPLVAGALRGEPPANAVYDGRTPVQSYFPGHLFYALSGRARPDGRTLRRLRACFAEIPTSEWRLSAWEVARYVYDRIGHRIPGARAWIDRRRAAAPAELPAQRQVPKSAPGRVA